MADPPAPVREKCPRCRLWTERHHCASPTCGWFRCDECRIVFDPATGRRMPARAA